MGTYSSRRNCKLVTRCKYLSTILGAIKGIRAVTRFQSTVSWLIFSSILLTHSTLSAEDNFFTKLNPFKKKETEPVQNSITDQPQSSWSLPKWRPLKMPWSGPSFSFTSSWVADIKPPSFRGTWTQMTNGTKQAYDKSKSFFMPWTWSAAKQPSIMQASGTSRGVYRAVPKSAKAKKSFFSSWLGSRPEESRPSQTVGEFLSQERPKP